MLRLLVSLLTATACAASIRAAGEPPRIAVRRLAVDCVIVESGPRLLGAILGREADGSIILAVRRDWLSQTHPAFCSAAEQQEAELLAGRTQQIRERFQQWMAERAADAQLMRVLQEQWEELDSEIVDPAKPHQPSPSEFLLLTVPIEQVAFLYRQPERHRQIALFAWREHCDNVEGRSALSLARELQEGNVVADEAVDLSDRLPKLPDDDRQWAARQALFEYGVGRRLDFQGTQGVLFRTDPQAEAPQLPRLLTALLQSQLDEALADLVNGGGSQPKSPKRPFGDAQRFAAKEGTRGFLATQLDSGVSLESAVVTSQFVARMPDGTWETIWRHTVRVDATEPRMELEERIAGDPRVTRVLGLLDELGGEGARSLRGTALQFAAATMSAQQLAEEEFFEFRRRHRDWLNAPPLRWNRNHAE